MVIIKHNLEVMENNGSDAPLINVANDLGHYNDDLVFVNDNGEEVCEHCGSTNFEKVDGFENWICECGSHW